MNIYIGNLDYTVRDQQLLELFEAVGEVSSAKVITDRETGRSKGFGFVEMPNDDEANKAISSLNGSTIKDREISVTEARPREDRPSGGGGYNGGGRNRRY